MSDLKNQEQLRDDIATVLELSRASWKSPSTKGSEDTAGEGQSLTEPFPRSKLFKTLNDHPALSAAAVASVWYLGPARLSAVAITGVSLFLRHRLALIPIATHLVSSNIFKAKRRP